MVLIALLVAVPLCLEPPLPVVVVDRDDVRIEQSCIVQIARTPIIDANGNGVIRISGDRIVVDFAGARLHGAAAGTAPDAYTGTGMRVNGREITLKNVRVSGYKVGIHATDVPALVIDQCDVSENFRQRLRSSPRAEDASDWLWPHANDRNEWLRNYGAGLYIESSHDITVRNVRARNVQNGIVLNRVTDSKIYDNDCSFLSGWGLAMWRSSRNVVSRNAFDFCVRGYSHGVYNRGQDSAGILMFEQCSENLIAENSATHGGDGLFGFAGKEALGEVNAREALEWYRRRGNNDNVIVENDFSYAAAHGLEMTFSHGNQIWLNRFVGNAICGIWGGYSQDTIIGQNTFESNGDAGYGAERGGVNIEHGQRNRILANTFRANRCGIHLWWDDDAALLALPGVQVHGGASSDNEIRFNEFEDNEVAIDLRQTSKTLLEGGPAKLTPPRFRIDEESMQTSTFVQGGSGPPPTPPDVHADFDRRPIGETRPVGARPKLRGRDKIVMTEWGPHDYASPRYVRFGVESAPDGRASMVYRYLPALLAKGYQPPYLRYKVDPKAVQAEFIKLSEDEPRKKSMRFTALRAGVHPIEFSWGVTKERMEDLSSVLVATNWRVQHFQSPVDPREAEDAWRATGEAVEPRAKSVLHEPWAGGGPAGVEPDHFGTIASTALEFPPGRWRIRTMSDDGIRVWIDDDLVIDDWTWHAPTEHVHEFEIDRAREVAIRVEHFELDGYAILNIEIEPAN
ncbi:MAG: right-handed parallel beta-helix repeat-containing protein [Planctomycetota bacterium]|jgi:nitrous oxidase accessory protein NosD